jgi:hypothetical protein
MVFGLRKRTEPFATCPSKTSEGSVFVESREVCTPGELTASVCPKGFKIYGGSTQYSEGTTYCAGDFFKQVPRWKAKCYYSNFSDNEDTLATCCAGIMPQKYCAAGYCKNSQQCKQTLLNFCGRGENWKNKKICTPFMDTYPDAAKIYMSSKCSTDGSIRDNIECQSYCKNNPGKCPQVPGFCERNPLDPLCACIKSPLNAIDGGAAAPPSCFDTKCKTTGYQTKAMANVVKSGCNFVKIDCPTIIKASDGAVIKNVSVAQQCSADINRESERDRLNRDTPAKERTPQQNQDISNFAKSNETKMLEAAARDMFMYKVAGSVWVNYYVKNHTQMNNIANGWNMPITNRINLTDIPEPYYEKIKDIATGPSILIILFIILIVIAITWKLLLRKTKKKGGYTQYPIPLVQPQAVQSPPSPAINPVFVDLPKIGTY